jgi:hypothetical protein
VSTDAFHPLVNDVIADGGLRQLLVAEPLMLITGYWLLTDY